MFGLVFVTLGFILATNVLSAQSSFVLFLGLWASLNLIVVGLAFIHDLRHVFGKTTSGKLRVANRLLLMPFLLFTEVVRIAQNTFWPTPKWSEIVPGLYVGRICNRQHLPKDVSVAVDLTAEFPTPRSMCSNLRIVCLPTLDGGTPDWSQCQAALNIVDPAREHAYVFCANGHGRSVTFAAILLGYHGHCSSAEQAVEKITSARAFASPNRDQIEFIETAYQQFRSS